MFSRQFNDLCSTVVTEGCERLGMEMGIVSRIEDDVYTVVAIKALSDVFKPGDSCDLKKTYCRDVFALNKTLALTSIDGVPGLQRHPLYSAFALEAYISAPITHKNETWGTLNFSSMRLREHAFTDDDIAWIEGKAAFIAEHIEEK